MLIPKALYQHNFSGKVDNVCFNYIIMHTSKFSCIHPPVPYVGTPEHLLGPEQNRPFTNTMQLGI